MSEVVRPKYDPDDFDPPVVKEHKNIWSLVVPVFLVALDTWFYHQHTVFSPYHRAFQAGNWLGRIQMFDGLYSYVFVIFSIPFAFGYLLIARRYLLALGLSIWCGGVVFVGSILNQTNPPEVRYTAEMPLYEQAIATSKPFGDQYTEESGGRKLTYWRWISWGIDNAVGIIYDPLNMLSIEEDKMAFREPSTGVLFRIRRIEPKWYFVEHS